MLSRSAFGGMLAIEATERPNLLYGVRPSERNDLNLKNGASNGDKKGVNHAHEDKKPLMIRPALMH